MEFEDKKINFSKIFKYNDKYHYYYLRTLSATTDIELNNIITDYITNTVNLPMSFEERKLISINFNEVNDACSSQHIRLINLINESDLSELTAQNYTWWRYILNKK